jgi:L-threonylcarbamoyladenylate synthase
LRGGGLVAFPTETVYGLGADALNPLAVAKIFAAKGRPADNPLIVHIADQRELRIVARDVPAVAQKLMEKFWPGPLTFILSKTPAVPDVVTAGGKTVAVRMPANRVALALIKAAGCPIAAPSANLAGKPSPTTAAHVAQDFGDSIAMILDGGKTLHGLESTVVDVTGSKVEILRTGAVTATMMADILGYKPKIVSHKPGRGGKVRSPGMKYRHYAPGVPLILIGETDEKKMVRALQAQLCEFQKKSRKMAVAHTAPLLGNLNERGSAELSAGSKDVAAANAYAVRIVHAPAQPRVGILCVKEHAKFYAAAKYSSVKKIVICGSNKKPETFAGELYSALRKFKPRDVDVILAENAGTKGIGGAVLDRLGRAATKII